MVVLKITIVAHPVQTACFDIGTELGINADEFNVKD